jgi:hypothetical protein
MDLTQTSVTERKEIRSPLGDRIEIIITRTVDGAVISEEITMCRHGEPHVP